jgi:hypothetical protein
MKVLVAHVGQGLVYAPALKVPPIAKVVAPQIVCTLAAIVGALSLFNSEIFQYFTIKGMSPLARGHVYFFPFALRY